MSDNKIFNTRIQHKHDVEANWAKATTFVPKEGEIIIYDKDASYSYQRIKIGDGTHTVAALPFVTTTVNGKIGDVNLTAQDVGADEEGSAAAALGVAREEIEAIPQSDWNENDETSKAYVANRTHWVEEGLIEILPETSFTIDSSDGGTGEGWYITSPLTNPLIEGNTYKVVRNNIEYEVVAKVFTETADDGTTESLIYIGNGIVLGGTDTGEPFIFAEGPIDWQTNGIYALLMSLDGTTNFSFSVERNGEIVHPLDPKFFGNLRGQKQIIFTIDEDENVTCDTLFDEVYALDVGELQNAIIVNSLKSYGDTANGSSASYSVVGIVKGTYWFASAPFIEFTIRQCNILDEASYTSPIDLQITWYKVEQNGITSDLIRKPYHVQYLPQTKNGFSSENFYLIHRAGSTLWTSASESEMKNNLFERSNWNADDGVNGNILNRTHYTQNEECIIYNIPTSELNFSMDGTFMMENFTQPPENMPIEGQEIVVRWAGKEYSLTVKKGIINEYSVYYVGEPTMIFYSPVASWPYDNVEFCIIFSADDETADALSLYGAFCYNPDVISGDSDSFYVGIPAGYVKQLDPKYIPTAEETEILSMMLEEEALPVVQTEDGFVLCSAENEIMFI